MHIVIEHCKLEGYKYTYKFFDFIKKNDNVKAKSVPFKRISDPFKSKGVLLAEIYSFIKLFQQTLNINRVCTQ